MSERPLLVEASCTVGAAPDELFGFLAQVEALPAWVPMIKAARAQDPPGGPGPGTVRVINEGTLAETHETVADFEPPRRLSYSARDRDLKGMLRDHLSVLEVEPAEGGARFRWAVYGQPGNLLMRWFARPVIGHVVRGGCKALARRFPPS